jgi:hypothetical protein
VAAKLKTDENLPETVAALLRAADHDVTTVLGERLDGVADLGPPPCVGGKDGHS